MATVLDLRRTDDPRDIIHRTVESLALGQVVAIPTDTVYGLAIDGLNPLAMRRLAAVEGRSVDSPMVLAVRSADEILDYCCQLSPLARRLARRCMPGPLTLVTPAACPDSLLGRLPEEVRKRVIGPRRCVGFRVVDHQVVTALRQYLRGPLVLTSAARNGQPASTCGQQVIDQFADAVSLLLDDGPTRYSGASTVVRVIDHHWEILRHGAIEASAMNEFAKPLIVLVCTGNTCRSPMAEGIIKRRLAESDGRWAGINVISAGVAAGDGMPANPLAIDVMRQQGIDISPHTSRSLSDAIVNRADLILTLTRGHRDAILAAWPELESRVHTLRPDGSDIADPIGGSSEMYEQCAAEIRQAVDQWLQRLDDDFLPRAADDDGADDQKGA